MALTSRIFRSAIAVPGATSPPRISPAAVEKFRYGTYLREPNGGQVVFLWPPEPGDNPYRQGAGGH